MDFRPACKQYSNFGVTTVLPGIVLGLPSMGTIDTLYVHADLLPDPHACHHQRFNQIKLKTRAAVVQIHRGVHKVQISTSSTEP